VWIVVWSVLFFCCVVMGGCDDASSELSIFGQFSVLAHSLSIKPPKNVYSPSNFSRRITWGWSCPVFLGRCF
jgi:hypothetical protein